MNINAAASQQYLLELLRSDVNRRGLLPSTSAEYVRQLRPLTQTVPDVIALTQAEIVSWISERDTASKPRFRWLAIKALFRMLVEDQLVESNPCDKIRMPREQARPQPYVSDVDYDRLLASCDNGFMGRRDKVILTLLNSTGCRRCELVALTMGDVNLANGTVLIRKSKSGSGRYAYLDDQARKAIIVWQRTLTLASGVAPSSGSSLLVTGRLTALGADGVRLMLQRRGSRLGIHVSPHQFRRRLAVRWHLAGGSQLGLMTVAGWSSPTMPGRYAAQAASEIAREEHRRLFCTRTGGCPVCHCSLRTALRSSLQHMRSRTAGAEQQFVCRGRRTCALVSLRGHSRKQFMTAIGMDATDTERDMLLDFWYGCLYVVVEGWNELELTVGINA